MNKISPIYHYYHINIGSDFHRSINQQHVIEGIEKEPYSYIHAYEGELYTQ